MEIRLIHVLYGLNFRNLRLFSSNLQYNPDFPFLASSLIIHDLFILMRTVDLITIESLRT